MAQALQQTHGFSGADIERLNGLAATASALLAAFDRLLQAAARGPVLLHFAGLGSHGPEGEPLLLAADARPGDVTGLVGLRQLRQRVPAALRGNLVVVVDAGLAQGVPPDWRFARPAWGSEFAAYWGGYGVPVPRPDWQTAGVGGLCLLPDDICHIVKPPPPEPAPGPVPARRPRGRKAAQGPVAEPVDDRGITQRAIA